MSEPTRVDLPSRRTFLKAAGTAAVALGAQPSTIASQTSGQGVPAAARGTTPVRFGVDMYSLNAQNWTPFQQLEFAAKWNVKMVHFSEIRFLGTSRARRT